MRKDGVWLVGIMIALGVATMGAPTAYSFLIDGTEQCIETGALMRDGIEFIPLLHVCEAFGVSYEWDALTNKIKLYNQGRLMTIVLGDRMMDVNGAIEQLPAAPFLDKGTVVVPATITTLAWWQRATPPPVDVTKPSGGMPTIIIDPGHGGKDVGALNGNGLREKDLALTFACELKEVLEQHGMKVLLTRERDYFVSLENRVKMANTTPADLVISIHANAHDDPSVNGFEIFYPQNKIVSSSHDAGWCPEVRPVSAEDEEHTMRCSYELAQAINRAINKEDMVVSRGFKPAHFFLLKWLNKPAVLMEVGFITNYREVAQLSDPAFAGRMVNAIVEGITAYQHCALQQTKDSAPPADAASSNVPAVPDTPVPSASSATAPVITEQNPTSSTGSAS